MLGDRTERTKLWTLREQMGEAIIRPASHYGPAAVTVLWDLDERAGSVRGPP